MEKFSFKSIILGALQKYCKKKRNTKSIKNSEKKLNSCVCMSPFIFLYTLKCSNIHFMSTIITFILNKSQNSVHSDFTQLCVKMALLPLLLVVTLRAILFECIEIASSYERTSERTYKRMLYKEKKHYTASKFNLNYNSDNGPKINIDTMYN